MPSTLPQEVINRYKNQVFVETGTCFGDGVQLALNAGFKKIYSIEISEELYKQNCERFALEISQGIVQLVNGDSFVELPNILAQISQPITFWLDGHWDPSPHAPGQFVCPLLFELEYIAKHPIRNHTILIDDRRLFGDPNHGWGKEVTEKQVIDQLLSINKDYCLRFEDGYIPCDIIAAYPSTDKVSATAVKSDRSFYISCDGGFGNRFNSLVGGLYLAKILNLAPTVIWNNNNYCGANFTDLFDSTLESGSMHWPTFFDSYKSINLTRHNDFDRTLTCYPPNLTDLPQLIEVVCSSSDPIVYHTDLIPSWVDTNKLIRDILPTIPFHRHLQTKANQVIAANTLGSAYHGVHLRRTDADNVDENMYHSMVTSNPDKKFFVCSDDKDTEVRFAQYPNVFVHEKTSYVEKLVEGHWNTNILDSSGKIWPFNVNRSQVSVIEAIVDLIILGRSQVVPTNSNSTYLRTAMLLHKYYQRSDLVF